MTTTTTAPAALSTALDGARAIAAVPVDGRAPVLATEAALDQSAAQVARAELIATAHGVYEASVNGAPASDSVLDPGWTVYESRLQVQRFDVTAQVREGGDQVQLSMLLGRGWWNGDFGFGDANANYGEENALLAALEVTFEDG